MTTLLLTVALCGQVNELPAPAPMPTLRAEYLQPTPATATTVLPPQIICRGGQCYSMPGVKIERSVMVSPRPVCERYGPLRRWMFGPFRYCW